MALLTAPNTYTQTVIPGYFPMPIEATTQIWQYGWVATNAAGNIVPVQDTSGLVFQGYANQSVNNTGIAGAATVGVVRPGGGEDGGSYRYWNLPVSTNNATQAWVGTNVYWVFDWNVTQSTSNSIIAGRVVYYINAGLVTVDMMSGIATE